MAVTRDTNLRWPIYLTIVTAAATVIVAMRFVEPAERSERSASSSRTNLNHVTARSMRATVLSFKGMALNVGYGLIGYLYALLGGHLRTYPELAVNGDTLFMRSIAWFPWYFATGTILVVLLSLVLCPNVNRVFRSTAPR